MTNVLTWRQIDWLLALAAPNATVTQSRNGWHTITSAERVASLREPEVAALIPRFVTSDEFGLTATEEGQRVIECITAIRAMDRHITNLLDATRDTAHQPRARLIDDALTQLWQAVQRDGAPMIAKQDER